jgi:hypothetical protein
MAQSSLPAFTLPQFPQVLDSLLDRQIARVDRILAVWDLPACEFSDGRYSCRNRAEVSDIETGADYCLGHFEEAHRG